MTDGRWLEEGDSTAIVLDRGFALDRGVSVGDRVPVAAAGGTGELEVVGLAIDTVDCL